MLLIIPVLSSISTVTESIGTGSPVFHAMKGDISNGTGTLCINEQVATSGTYINEDEASITIGNDYVELFFDKSNAGGLDKIIDKETGIDLRPDKGSIPTLFLIWIFNGTAIERAFNWQAINTEYNSKTESDYSTLTIVNSNLKGYDIHATTTITIHNEDQFVEMRLSIENNEEFIIENILFPIIWGLGQIGSESSDDALFYPVGDGLLLHDPLSELENLIVSGGRYPGTLSMQLLCHFDKDETGLYFATYDTEGNPKTINYGPMEWGGTNHLATSFEFYIPESEGNDFIMDYNTILGTFHGDWHKAASMYKEWAETTPFISGGKIYEEKDTPEWFGKTSIIQLDNRDGPEIEYFSLSDIEQITNQYSENTGIDTTVLIFGWEKNGAWIGPDYYPPVEGEQAFRNTMNNLKSNGNHGFTYISGTVWRITRPEIGYADLELFNSTGLPWVALDKDGNPYFDPFYELMGWHSARMDPMTNFWHEMVVENVLESVRLGVDVVQIDEFPIGAIYPCYNESHGHPIGYSKNISDAYRSILEDIRNQGRNINPDFIMSIEEPCEYYLPYADAYVSRDCAPENFYPYFIDAYGDKVEFIQFFPFVYHEYITSFGKGISMDKEYATVFYNQMARASARMFTSGEIMRSPGVPKEKWNMELFELFKRTATATSSYAGDYLLRGEPLAPPEIDVPSIKTYWFNHYENRFGTPIHEPAVFHSAWRADDGTKGFVFVNWYTSTIDFEVEIKDDELPYGYYAIAISRNGERTIIYANTTLPKTLSLSLKQNDVVLIEIVDVVDTNPPNIPEIDGPTSGKINTEYTYTVAATDPDGDDVSFFIDWGDGTDSGWTDFVPSGIELNVSYTWDDEDTYMLKVKAKDVHDVGSDWQTLEVSMPKNKRVISSLFLQLLEKLIERFPIIKQMLHLPILANSNYIAVENNHVPNYGYNDINDRWEHCSNMIVDGDNVNYIGTDGIIPDIHFAKLKSTILDYPMVLVNKQNTDGIIAAHIETEESGTTYYVATDGSDSNDGLSEETAWKTMAKVNSVNFNPADLILFKRGERWNEALSILSSGSEDDPIIFGAYGEGTRPVIYTNTKACINIEDKEHIIIKDFELKDAERGVWITGDANGYIKLNNLVIHDVTNHNGISIKERENILIEDCKIYDCSKGNGICAYNEGLKKWTMLANHNITVKNCTIYNNCKNGVYIAGHNAYISNNTIHSNGITKYYHNIYLIGENGIVEHNELYSSPAGDGFRYEGGHLKIRYNYVHDNGKHGISFWNDFPDTFFDNEIYYNIIEGMDDNHWGIHVNEYAGGFDGVKIYNNVICGENFESRGMAFYDCSNIDLKNNIVFVKDMILTVGNEGTYGFSSDYNCWLSNINTPFKWDEQYGNFIDFQSLGYDVHSYFADPLFVDLDGSDFHLQSCSPAIDSGVDLGYSLDFDDNSVPFGAAPDIGAFEFHGKQGLRCNGALSWNNIKPGSTVNRSFTIENAGDPDSEIDWEITEWPIWGSWTFDPSDGDDLKPEDGPITIQVSVVAPDEQNKDFGGKVKIVNKNDSNDFCTLSVSLVTPKNKISNSISVLQVLEKIIQRFPILERMLLNSFQ